MVHTFCIAGHLQADGAGSSGDVSIDSLAVTCLYFDLPDRLSNLDPKRCAGPAGAALVAQLQSGKQQPAPRNFLVREHTGARPSGKSKDTAAVNHERSSCARLWVESWRNP